MKLKRRNLIILAAVVSTLITGAVVVVHLPPVQRAIWNHLSAAIEKSSGWEISADDFALRAFPARLRMNGVTVASGGRAVALLGRLEARWGWLEVMGVPHRLDLLVLDGVEIDPGALPEQSAEADDSAVSVWELVEIGELRVVGTGGAGSYSGIEVTFDGLHIDGQIVSGLATARVSANNLSLGRDGRLLDFGSLDLKARGSQDGFQVERLAVGSAATGLLVSGEMRFTPSTEGRLDLGAEIDTEIVAHWWDPNLVTGLDPAGRLELEGHVAVTEVEGPNLFLRHRGGPVRVAGYDIEELELAYSDGRPSVYAAHPGWGRATVTMTAPGAAALSASFDQAPVDRVLAFAAPRVTAYVGAPATLSGEIDGTVSYPVLPEFLSGRVNLELRSPLGHVAVLAEGAGSAWEVAELNAQAMGAVLKASGLLEEDGSISAEAVISAVEARQVAESFEGFSPSIAALNVGGGPVEIQARIGGTLATPNLTATAEWADPGIAGRHVESFTAEVSGELEEIDWKLSVSPSPATSLVASGTARPLAGEAEGVWEMQAQDLQELADLLEVPPDLGVRGRVHGKGSFVASLGDVRVEGEISAPDLTAGDWSIGDFRAHVEADPDFVVVRDLAAEAYSGSVAGGLTASLTDVSAPLKADLTVRGADLGSVPVELPEAVAGIVSAGLHLEGSLANPEGDLEISWTPDAENSLVGETHLVAGLSDGKLRMVSDRIEAAGNPVLVEIVAPLGDLRLPEWLWPEAPGGAIQAKAEIPGFHSGPMTAMLGLDDLQAEVEADLRAELTWDPRAPENPRVLAEATNLRVLHPSGNFEAEGPLVVSMIDGRLELAPVVLVGLGSRIEASAVYDPATEVIDGRLRSHLAPEVSAMAPVPLNIEGPITVDADFEVPAERTFSMEAVRGALTVDHRDGRMVMREPPVEIRNLRIDASLDDGILEIVDGSAEVNRGRVDLGGGWDPQSVQGLVLDLDNVTTMVGGILTQWDGEVAIEPHADRLAHVSGDLALVVGLWDERVDLASAMLGADSTATTETDMLHDVSLDLTVRGRAGIRVENNLGRFDVNWDQLRVGGTAALPVLRGEVRIASGGVLTLAGQEVEVRRGVVEFTGNPDIDPLLEIVPESDTTLFGDEEGVGATELATRGLAQGVSSALGFENETLRPAEIAVQTESDPSVRFMVGQRLSRQLALFLAFNLTDVQDRLTMLQYWNVPRFKGIALQVYQETSNNNLGANIFQRFEWGGSRKITDRPEIHRLRLEGDWPISQRGLRRATRLRRGQRFDPFLLFVGAVRMERRLAEQGFQSAWVTGNQEGAPASPTLVFSCEPGDPQPVDFDGDSLPVAVRREVTAMYRPPPREGGSFDAMVSEVRRHLVREGYLESDIAIERRGEKIVIDVRKGQKTELQGPFFEGMPVDTVIPAVRALGRVEALALAVDQPEWARRMVERILRSAGFFEARVLDIWLDPIESGVAEVHLSVAAGERAVVETVEIVGDDPLGLTVNPDFSIRSGMPLDRLVIDSAARDLRHAYVKEGYRDARVRSSIEERGDGSWDIEVKVDPGRQRTVREIRFAGRRHVSEKVLLKGVTLAPGEVLTDDELDRSASRIANFSPVERDSVTVMPVGTSQADVEFGVVEKKRWTLEAGGGWSTERSFGAAFGARDDNLFGRGIGLNLRGSLDAVEKKIFLLGSIPPVPGGRLSFITTIGYSTGDAPDEPELLNQDQKLASLEASYRLPKSVQVGVYYRWTDTRTYEKVPDDFFPLDINVRVGTLGARTIIERFDYLFDPRSGWGLTSDIGWSGEAIGSDLEYVSWLTGFSLALEPIRDTTWMQGFRFGVAEPLKGTSLDREARYFAGGQASVRGFDLNTVGPLTFGIDGSLVPAGGGALFILNEELRIPIWGPARVAVFADIGQVWESWREADSDLSVGVGFGVRVSTPIGPLWADIAWPVANIGISSKKAKFYLGIGRPF
jgi:outer membrane protein assembly factor BamA